MLVADGADPVSAVLGVLAAVLADPHAARAAGGASVDDAAQLGAAARARAAALQADTQRALAAEVLKLSFQSAGKGGSTLAGRARRRGGCSGSLCESAGAERLDSGMAGGVGGAIRAPVVGGHCSEVR